MSPRGGAQNAAHEQLKAQILTTLGVLPGIALFSNIQGKARQLYSDAVFKYGLGTGTSDIVGIVSREKNGLPLLQSMQIDSAAYQHFHATLSPVGLFFAIEVKTGLAVPTTEQASFLAMVRAFGGVSGVARSVPDAMKLYAEARGK